MTFAGSPTRQPPFCKARSPRRSRRAATKSPRRRVLACYAFPPVSPTFTSTLLKMWRPGGPRNRLRRTPGRQRWSSKGATPSPERSSAASSTIARRARGRRAHSSAMSAERPRFRTTSGSIPPSGDGRRLASRNSKPRRSPETRQRAGHRGERGARLDLPGGLFAAKGVDRFEHGPHAASFLLREFPTPDFEQEYGANPVASVPCLVFHRIVEYPSLAFDRCTRVVADAEAAIARDDQRQVADQTRIDKPRVRRDPGPRAQQ